MDLIAVVMKAPSSQIRFKNASSLLDYGFNNFEYKTLLSSGDKIKNVNIEKGTKSDLVAIAESNCGHLITKGNDVNIEQNVSIDNLTLPVKKGQIIGSVNFVLNGDVISSSNLLSDSDVDKLGIFSMNKLVLKKWFYLLR